jgi:cyclophilin family peptidyl-prolyl cis-trans isomerase
MKRTFKSLKVLFTAALFVSSAAMASPSVEMQTSLGTIVIELDSQKAPLTVANFLKYANDGFYNATIFHRVIKGFMIQGGGFTQDMQQKTTNKPLENEAKNGLKNDRGTIAMARTNAPHSATAQFFINHKNNAMLDFPGQDGWGYAVFGKVISGMEVVDKIAQSPTASQDVPVKPIIIQSVKVISEKK